MVPGMSAVLRRWGPLGGAGLIGAFIGALTLGVTRCDVAVRDVAARAARDTSVNGRLGVLERDSGELREFRVRLRRLEAGQAAMLAWMAAVSPRLGVPPPPAPARFDASSFPTSYEGAIEEAHLKTEGGTR